MAGRVPPARKGQPYYDADQGRRMIRPVEGGKPIPYLDGGRRRFSAARALRRSGLELGHDLADDTATVATAIGSRQPFDLGAAGGLIITAAASLLGLLLLDLLLSQRGATGYSAVLGGMRRATLALIDPTHPLFARTPAEKGSASTPTATTTRAAVRAGSSSGAGSGAEVFGAGSMVFPVASAQASFSDDFAAPRAGGAQASGGRHGAIDIVAERGTPVVAVEAGVIGSQFGFNTYGGKRLHLVGAQERDWYYAHLDKYAPGIGPGARVLAGQVLGWVGHTGTAGGVDHLHLSLSQRGLVTNPFALLKQLFSNRPRATTTTGRTVTV